jgi:hypothetical protein
MTAATPRVKNRSPTAGAARTSIAYGTEDHHVCAPLAAASERWCGGRWIPRRASSRALSAPLMATITTEPAAVAIFSRDTDTKIRRMTICVRSKLRTRTGAKCRDTPGRGNYRPLGRGFLPALLFAGSPDTKSMPRWTHVAAPQPSENILNQSSGYHRFDRGRRVSLQDRERRTAVLK